MSETKWTPGHWKAFYSEDDGRHEIRMADALPEEWESDDQECYEDYDFPGMHATCHLIEWEHCIYPDDMDFPEAQANANLIAAAPDLYAALEPMIPFVEAFRIGEGSTERSYEFFGLYIVAAKAALAKARGEA